MTATMTSLRLPRMRVAPASEPWMHDSACRGEDPNIFVPDRSQPRETVKLAVAVAKSFCVVCPVAQQCLEHGARINDEDSVRAGLFGRQLQLRIREIRRGARGV